MKLNNVLKRSVWSFVSIFFAIAFTTSMVGGRIMKDNASSINGTLKINPYVIENNGDENTEYFSSDFKNEDGSLNDVAMRQNSLDVGEQVASEGMAVLFNKNNALPLNEGSKVSLFGIGSVNFATGSSGGSGGVAATIDKDFKQTLETSTSEGGAGFEVNNKLWDFYKNNAYPNGQGYGGWRMSSGSSCKDTRYNQDPYYREFSVCEAPWNKVVEGVGSDVVSSYNDAAIMTITRNSGEDGDIFFKSDECLDNSYLDLSKDEYEVINQLCELKRNGKLKRIIILINTRTSFQMKNLLKFDEIDACINVGFGGNATYKAISNVLSGKTNPSGHLVDTFVNDIDSMPSTMNFGDFTFSEISSSVPESFYTASCNDKYVVYQEGIYLGYKYYETRYEDSILGGRNAKGTNGSTTNNEWSFNDEVAFPFGHGVSYTTFGYSDYQVNKNGENYKISLTIENTGSLSGKEVMQVYLQKPYTDYDKENNIEKASVELVGFAKTKLLEPNEKETLTVEVKGEDFKTYDSYNKRTYILEKGDYYLGVGTSSHNAINNILAKKGYSTSNGMDENGNSSLVEKITINNDDFEKYSVSSQTGYKITNQFDDVDINLYEGTKDQKITYLSRSNWNETYPTKPVSLKCTDEKMVYDMQYAHVPEANENDTMPLMETITSEFGELNLAMIKDLPFNDPMWEDLLNQLSWNEMNYLCTYGYLFLAGAVSVGAPGARAQDGPLGIRAANANLDNTYMGFPSAIIMAQTWDTDLINKLGVAFAHEIMHVGYQLIYATGINLHRNPYGGRNAEYYSEDSFISSMMSSYEIKGLKSKGIIVCAKHFALNDQEKNRRAVSTFANEQTIREIYLKPFEISITEGGADSIMSSLNRIGCTSSVVHKGLLTEVLKKEWGFTGFVESDSAFGLPYIIDDDVKAEAIVAGSDVWMLGGSYTAWDKYKDNPTIVKAIREACHRILYVQSQSIAMNGISASSKVVKIKTWWEKAIDQVQISLGVVMGLSIATTISAFVYHAIYKKKEEK